MNLMSRVSVLLLCGMLAACANNPLLKADKGIPAYDDKIASDAVTRLASLYPPAKTQFNLEAIIPESFAALLAEKLRAKGYAVSESRPAKTGFCTLLTGDTFGDVYPTKPVIGATAPAAPVIQPVLGIALRYVLDHSPAGDFSRITLKVGNSLLARAYIAVDGMLAPAGAWTYRE
jgi:hypothetical protein